MDYPSSFVLDLAPSHPLILKFFQTPSPPLFSISVFWNFHTPPPPFVMGRGGGVQTIMNRWNIQQYLSLWWTCFGFLCPCHSSGYLDPSAVEQQWATQFLQFLRFTAFLRAWNQLILCSQRSSFIAECQIFFGRCRFLTILDPSKCFCSWQS